MTPRELPLLPASPGGPHGTRSAMTCLHRCGNACDKSEPNLSGNPGLRDLIEDTIARRSVLKAGAAGLGALVVGGLVPTPDASAATTGEARLGRVAFTSVAPNVRDAVSVPRAFTHDVVVKWGDPVTADAPAFDVRAQSATSASKQFGYNCDYVGVLPLDASRSLLVANHEYTNPTLMFPAGRYGSRAAKLIAMASVGLSVVEIQRRQGERTSSWRRCSPATSAHNRRITARTPFAMTGPAVGDPRLRTTRDPAGGTVHGTLSNCSGGTTPWGTVLSGEENFDGYFDKSGSLDPRYQASYARYGINGNGRGWREVAPRFDLSREPHEPFRFGWIVEVDPYQPASTPRKHTMLGRFKHEGANVTLSTSGRAVCYLGDDERGEYVYKFVSRDAFDGSGTDAARAHNMTLLTHGTLYVARFTGSGSAAEGYAGTGQWLALTSDTQSFVAGMSVADVLIDTRIAADKLAPTRMDRPEDIQPNPVNGRIYCSLTNNVNRGSRTLPVDGVNPVGSSLVRDRIGAPLRRVSGNRHGYVLEITETGGDHTAQTFDWALMLVCGDPGAPETYFAGYPKDRVSAISCPDNVAFDAEGNLWIATNSGTALGSNDGLFRVPVAGPERGRVKRFLTVPVGAEACGPLIAEDQLAVFVAVQHPGETDGATFADPSSTWPHTNSFPRSAVIVAYRA